MQIHEITQVNEGLFDKFKQATGIAQQQATQALRQRGTSDKFEREKAAAAYSVAQPSAGTVLPDPGNLLMVVTPSGGKYYKDIQNVWRNELNQIIPVENVSALEKLISMDQYQQILIPTAQPATGAVRKVSKRRGQ